MYSLYLVFKYIATDTITFIRIS